MLLSSLPVSATLNAGASCSTAVIGFAGGVIAGGLFVCAALTAMLTAWFTAPFTLSLSVAVNLAVPEKVLCSVTRYVTLEVPWPPETVTLCTPVPAAADQLKTLLSSEPVSVTVNGAAPWVTLVIGLAGVLINGGLLVTVQVFTGLEL